MSPASRQLVFDVGGTQLRAALCDAESGVLLDVAREDSPSHDRHPDLSFRELRERLLVEMSRLRRRVDPRGEARDAAVAFPGPVDERGRVLAAPTLWGELGRYPDELQGDLESLWRGARVRIVNDVAAAGYRYLREPDDDFCIAAVSTGIGNKVFVGGRPLVGKNGQGGEIGHLQVDRSPGAAPCDCGGRGHLGAIASGRASAARARERAAQDPAFVRSMLGQSHDAQALTAESLAAAYRAGDEWAARVVQEGADALGLAFAALHLGMGVERFVLVGGFAPGLGERFCEDVRRALGARCWRGSADRATVSLGEGDGHCALLGCGRALHQGLLP